MATYERVGYGSPDGLQVQGTISEKIALYGTTPVSQRAGSWQATSLVGTASSADFTTDAKACVIEIMNTLTALGIWKGGA